MKIRLTAALWLAVSILPAAADSRDAVRDRMSRCDELVQTRQYLDCLYAAMQPLRAELNLAPAPQAPTYAPLFASNNAPPTRAAAANSSQKGVSGFFDRLVTGEAFLGGPQVAPEQFGLRNAKPGRGENVDHIAQPVTGFTFDGSGLFTITLANGQVWAQQGYDEKRAEWRKGDPLVATIGYGASNTFNLSVGDNTLYKVHRVK